MDEIKFGTDGWRAVVADSYTYDNLTTVSRATAAWVQDQAAAGHGDGSVVVGYDTRFQGDAFARHVASVMASAGVRVRLADEVATTPAVSWMAREGGHTAGIVVTASHNPPQYNGFKIKSHLGGPATPEMIADVEARLGAAAAETGDVRAFDALVADGLVETFDLRGAYVALLRDRLDVDAIKGASLRVAYDAMYGAGLGIVSELLGRPRVVELHHERNPGMHGQAPEPIERNLGELLQTVVDETCGLGLATDGDADRIGLVDEEGQFVDSHKILALLVKYLHTEKGLRGDIVKTFSTTDMLDRMGEKYGLTVVTTPIGFKYVGPRMVETDVLVGGEESGGMAVKGHIPERDGLFIGLTVAEMMVARERTLSGLVRELMDEFGPHHQARTDLHTTPARKEAVLKQLADGLAEVAGRPVTATETLDGVKFRVDGGWLMFRASGTEPVLRIYSEASTPDAAEALVAWGVAMVEGG